MAKSIRHLHCTDFVGHFVYVFCICSFFCLHIINFSTYFGMTQIDGRTAPYTGLFLNINIIIPHMRRKQYIRNRDNKEK